MAQKLFKAIFIIGLTSNALFSKETEDSAQFVPPANWRLAEQQMLPEHVKIMVVGQGKGEFPPSINLAIDPFDGTLDEYMKVIKSILNSQKAVWKDMGPFAIGDLKGRLIQVDSRSKWGEERQMQLITLYKGAAYILTAAALVSEFHDFYPDFFAAFKSFKINAQEVTNPQL